MQHNSPEASSKGKGTVKEYIDYFKSHIGYEDSHFESFWKEFGDENEEAFVMAGMFEDYILSQGLETDIQL